MTGIYIQGIVSHGTVQYIERKQLGYRLVDTRFYMSSLDLGIIQ